MSIPCHADGGPTLTLRVPTTGEAVRPRPLHGARPAHPRRAAVRPGPLLLPDHGEQLQAHRGQDPAARAERGHGERADGQAAVAVGVGQLAAPQVPAGGLQSGGELGRAAVLQGEEGAAEPAAEAAAQAAAAARAPQRGPGQAEAPAGPQEEPQPPQSPLRGVTPRLLHRLRRSPSFLFCFLNYLFPPNSHLKLRRGGPAAKRGAASIWPHVDFFSCFFLHEALRPDGRDIHSCARSQTPTCRPSQTEVAEVP